MESRKRGIRMTWQCKKQYELGRKNLAEYVIKALRKYDITPADLFLVEWVEEK